MIRTADGKGRWRKWAVFFLLFFLLAALAGCSRPASREQTNPPGVTSPNPTGSQANPSSNTAAPATVSPEPAKEQLVSPLTGRRVAAELVKRRPLAVMIDNAPAARPQSGLNRADLVFEALVEGGITRFMAVFLESDSEVLGPVRSARHYFLDLALGLDAVYVHVGGSPQAYQDLSRLKVANLDNMKVSAPFWRTTSRQAPHNLYTSTLKLREELRTRKLEKEGPAGSSFVFAEKKDLGGTRVNEIGIYYPGGYQGYFVTFRYEAGGDDFLRFIKNEPHRNEASGEQLRTKNVVVLFAETRPIPQDDAGRIDINLVGSGKALVFSAGQAREGKWEKTSRQAPLKLLTTDGKPLALAVGPSWVEIVPPETRVEVK